MKFRSERDALIEMLATAGRAVGARATSSPVLSGLLLSCTGNVLSVTGTDLDLTIQVTEEVIGVEDGTCVVPARLSTDIVRRLEPGAVTFANDDDHITISAARSNFKLRTYPVVEFPAVGRTTEATTQLPEAGPGRSRAPGGAGRLARRRPPPSDRCPVVPRRRVHPHGGDRLLPDGHA